MTWKFHEETKDKQPNRDFTKLNKKGVGMGAVKANVIENFKF
jgi:hypothetical protein